MLRGVILRTVIFHMFILFCVYSNVLFLLGTEGWGAVLLCVVFDDDPLH